MVAGEPTGEATPPGNWQQVSVFLSPMDVHVNRIPVSGRVIRVGIIRAVSARIQEGIGRFE